VPDDVVQFLRDAQALLADGAPGLLEAGTFGELRAVREQRRGATAVVHAATERDRPREQRGVRRHRTELGLLRCHDHEQAEEHHHVRGRHDGLPCAAPRGDGVRGEEEPGTDDRRGVPQREDCQHGHGGHDGRSVSSRRNRSHVSTPRP
jgi:hypothetical protein